MNKIEKRAYRNLIKAGWSDREARIRAAIIARAEAGPCRCSHVRHGAGDERCPATRKS